VSRLGAEFDDFVIGRSPALLRTAVLLLGDRNDAEDLLQTALLRVARHWSRARENPDAYTRRVLVNLAHDHARRRRRHPESLNGVPDAPGRDVTSEGREDLLPALRALPERQRATVVLRFWEDLSVAETAALLGCSEGTVKSTTSKALARLRGVLDVPTVTTSIGADDEH
jgi:RNA polymerase sigma-70 factor (sigma-E family)